MALPKAGCALFAFAIFIGFFATIPSTAQSSAPLAAFDVCKPVGERTGELGCWILGDQPVERIDQAQVFWHLDVYATRSEAERAKGPRGVVLKSLGKVWLFTIERAGWRPALPGERIAEIGPLPVTAGEEYSALFLESIFNPGMASGVHTHSGPEAWYTQAGETCLETPAGKMVSRPGAPAFVPAGPPMVLTAIGTSQRRGITLILHDSSKPPTTMVHDWTPKGLCKVP